MNGADEQLIRIEPHPTTFNLTAVTFNVSAVDGVRKALPDWLMAPRSTKIDPPMGLRCGNSGEKKALHRKVLERHLRNALRFAFIQHRESLIGGGIRFDIDKFIDHAVVGLLGYETENGLAGRYDPAYPAPPGLFSVLTQLMASQDHVPPLLGELEEWREPGK